MSSDNEQKWVRMFISEACNISISQYAEILNRLVRLGMSVPVLETIISGLSGYDITVVNVPGAHFSIQYQLARSAFPFKTDPECPHTSYAGRRTDF